MEENKKIKVMIVGDSSPIRIKVLMDKLTTQSNLQVSLIKDLDDKTEEFEYKMFSQLRDPKHEKALEKQRRAEKNWKTKNRPWR